MKTCFVSLYAYPLFNPALRAPFGGSEVRCWLLGVGLSKLPGEEVSFVVFDHGQPEVQQFGSVKVYRHSYYRSQPGESNARARLSGYLARSPRFPFVSIKRRDWAMLIDLPSALIDLLTEACAERLSAKYGAPLRVGSNSIRPDRTRIYQKIDADIYAGFGVSPLTAEMIAFCQRSGKKSVLFAGSDVDFMPMERATPDPLPPQGPRDDIRHHVLLRADLILTQTDTQRRLLQERFGRKGVILRNPIDLSQIPSGDEVGSEREEIALWIGKSDRIKRPEILLQLAAAFPDKQFVMVLNRSDPALFQAVVQNRPANVQILEWVSFQESERLFARAFVLVNTSSFEGFPNTFLQAGKYGVPLLSLQVDPEGFIERHTCGIVAQGSFDRLVNGFHLICSDQDRRSLFARNVQEYVQRHHALEEKIAQLHHLLSDLRGDG